MTFKTAGMCNDMGVTCSAKSVGLSALKRQKIVNFREWMEGEQRDVQDVGIQAFGAVGTSESWCSRGVSSKGMGALLVP